jgi:RNA polymerase sigma-70 factor (ECF subfamily)
VSLDEISTSQDEPITRQYGVDDRRLMGTIDRIILNQAIADLPSGYRTALVLFDLEGYEHHEIADVMKCSVGSSKSQLHKARTKLRKLLRLHDGKSFRQAGPASSAYEAKKSFALRDKATARRIDLPESAF